VSGSGIGLFQFGRGLVVGASDPVVLWSQLTAEFRNSPDDARNPTVLGGYLQKLSERSNETTERLLDEVLAEPTLRTLFLYLQTKCPIYSAGYHRLLKALEYEDISIDQFQFLAAGSVHETISDDELALLLEAIAARPGGVDVAIEILSMRFHGTDADQNQFSNKLKAAGRRLLVDLFGSARVHGSRDLDYEVAGIMAICLNQDAPDEEVVSVLQSIGDRIRTGSVFRLSYPSTLLKAAELHPLEFLDASLGQWDGDQLAWMFSDSDSHYRNPLSAIHEEHLLSWCSVDPVTRFARAAAAIEPFIAVVGGDGEQTVVLSPIAIRLLESAGDPSEVMSVY
ncbi:MAG: hypothetical protein ACREA0_34615, partial [bacterium]